MPTKRKSGPRRSTRARHGAGSRTSRARRSAGRAGASRPAGPAARAAASRRRPRPTSRVRRLREPELGELIQVLAARVLRRFRPDVVIGIARGGVIVGQALAAVLGAEFHPVRLANRRRDPSLPRLPLPVLPDLQGRRVLVVDDLASSGLTLARARALSRKRGSRDVRTAVVVEQGGDARPDFAALRTDATVIFDWDAAAAGGDPGETGV